MKFSTFSILPIALLATSVFAAPVAVAEPAAVAIPNPSVQLQQRDVLSDVASDVENALPSGLANALGSWEPVQGIVDEVKNVTGLLENITSILTSTTDLPSGTLTDLAKILKEFVGGVIDTLGKETGLTGISNALNDLLNDTFNKLDNLAKVTHLSQALNAILDTVIGTLKATLIQLVTSVVRVVEDLLKLNLVGALVQLFSGAFSVIDTFLTNLSNGLKEA